jgi:hypothetical protein
MSRWITARFRDAPASGPAGHYRLAGVQLTTFPPLDRLAPFRCSEPGGNSIPPAEISAPQDESYLIRRVEGVVGDRILPVECWAEAGGHRLVIPGLGSYRLGYPAPLEVVVTVDADASDPLAVSGLLGPVLALAHARLDLWGLHASAVLRQGRLLAFAGDSGAGKSTLARYLVDSGWAEELAADDVLPLRRTPEGLIAFPRFPQPRLPAAASARLPERIEVHRIFLLARPRPGDSLFTSGPLPPREAASKIGLQIVGASLFDTALLGRHLDLAAAVAKSGAVRSLCYPFGLEELPHLVAFLGRELGF